MQAHNSGFLRTILREVIPLSGEDRIWQALQQDS